MDENPQKTTLEYAYIPRPPKERGRIVGHLPLIFGVVNLAICAPLLGYDVFVHSVHGWDQADFIVMLVALIDFPASIPVVAIFLALFPNTDGPGAVAFMSSLFLVAGFFWYYLLGMGLRWLIRWRS